ncbi:hydroxyethylthiazole kinase [Paenibacillus sp. OAS669]|uniref:hydroxyethylthiazole kinase n=1 Tax=Paenibacillus sp. OAS669 TaxID=2663821 RepID=UPI001789892B|nr:hydroxyethylthiazole kinase [Paenibacillus sp. OAS669]MBE1446833.1 hydroxyethylthiazole kinase [Paenibacillus sp. OAS669]
MDKQNIIHTLDKVRASSPLVHNITNVVVTQFTANGLLALGASPVMAYAKEEVADMARIAGALVLNIGTLDETVVEAMLIAGRSANEHQVPVIFDPVGAGATPYRTETSRRIMKELKVSILRGNAAEIANVIGEAWNIKGVDAAGETTEDIGSLAMRAAQAFGCVVVVTGADDYVSNGSAAYKISGGTPLLTRVTGTGCLLTSIIGAFAAVETDYMLAAVSALSFYSAAADAAVQASAADKPGTFQTELLNQLHQMNGTEWSKYLSVSQING